METKTFHGSWMGKNKANVAALREMADWLEQNPQVSLRYVMAHSDEDMYVFVVFYEED